MIRYIISLLLLSHSGIWLIAQRDIPLPGVVVEQNSKFNTGTVITIPGAEIRAEFNSTISDERGKFTLVFVDKPFGSIVRIYAAKNGYELVNAEELKKAAVIGRTSPLSVVMCRKDQLHENQLDYYRIARDAWMDAYRVRVSNLEKEVKEKEAMLEQMAKDFNVERLSSQSAIALLNAQLQDAQKQARDLADRFVAVNLDDQSETYQRAFRAFLAKDIDGAIRIANSIDLRKRLRDNAAIIRKAEENISGYLENKAIAQAQLKQDIEQAMFLAQMHRMVFQFHLADSLYAIANEYDQDTVYFKTTWEYGIFLREQHQFERAHALFSKMMLQLEDLVKNNFDCYQPAVASTMNMLGVIEYQTHENDSAKVNYENALKIYRELNGKNQTNPYLPEIAMILNNLGILQGDVHEFSEAKSHHEEALDISRRLAYEDSIMAFLPDVAANLNNLGLLLRDMGAHEEARTRFEEARQIYNDLACRNPDYYLPNVATTLNNLGILSQETNETAIARAYFENALMIYQTLGLRSPDVYLTEVEAILNNLCTLLREDKNLGDARCHCKEAFRIASDLAHKNPKEYRPLKAKTMNNLGNLLHDLNEMSAAKSYYVDALQIYRELDTTSPEIYQTDLAGVLSNLADLLQDINEIDTAQTYLEEALSIRRKLAARNPSIYRPLMAVTLNELGILLRNMNAKIAAQSRFEEALSIYRELANDTSGIYMPKVVGSLNNLGTIQVEINDFANARLNFEEATTIYWRFASENRQAYMPEIAISLKNLGALLRETGEVDISLLIWREGLIVCRELAQKHPETYSADVATCLSSIGAILHEFGDKSAARLHFQEALSIRRELACFAPKTYLPEIAISLNELGALQNELGETAAALTNYQEALSIYLELSCMNAGAYLPEIAMASNNLGVLRHAIGEVSIARENYEDALRTYRKLNIKYGDAYLPNEARILHNLGLLGLQVGDSMPAIQQLEEALEILEPLAKNDTAPYGIEASQIAVRLAFIDYAMLNSMDNLPNRARGEELLEKAHKLLEVYKYPTEQIFKIYEIIGELTKKFQSFKLESAASIDKLRILAAAVDSAQTPHGKVQCQRELIQALEAVLMRDVKRESLRSQLPSQYGNLAWYELFNKNFPAAEVAARKGLKLATDEIWIHTNLALSLLYQGKWSEAKEIYLRFKDQPYGEATYAKAFLEGLDTLERAGIKHTDVEKARRLLR